jgi:hypothetical protein
MNAMFKIQKVNVQGERAYVRASVVKPCNFAVSSGSMLGGIRLRSELMEPEQGVFLFRLEHPAEHFLLNTGDTVNLET